MCSWAIQHKTSCSGGKSCKDYEPPIALTGPHSAGLGMRFSTGKMFPAEYQNTAFVVRKGSWNREKPSGFDVVNVRVDDKGKAIVKIDEVCTDFVEGRPNGYLRNIWTTDTTPADNSGQDDQGARPGRFTMIETECLGACGFVTPILIDDDFIESVTPAMIPELLARYP